MNDNRTQILAQDDADRAHMSNKMAYLHATIEQKNAYITTLEAELRDITAQRDAWFNMACAYALGQAPELKTVEPQQTERKFRVGLIYKCAGCDANYFCGNGWVASDGSVLCKDCNHD